MAGVGCSVEPLRAASVYQVEDFVALSFAVIEALRSAPNFVDLLKSRAEGFVAELVVAFTPSRLRRLMRVPVSSSVVSEAESSSEGGVAGRLRMFEALLPRFLKEGTAAVTSAIFVEESACRLNTSTWLFLG